MTGKRIKNREQVGVIHLVGVNEGIQKCSRRDRRAYEILQMRMTVR